MKESRADKIIKAVDGMFGGESGSKIPERVQKPELGEAVSSSQDSSKEESKLWGALAGLSVGVPNVYFALRDPEKSNWIHDYALGCDHHRTADFEVSLTKIKLERLKRKDQNVWCHGL